MKKNIVNSKLAIIILVIAVALVAVAVTIAAIALRNDEQTKSFTECADAGNSISQSFPETCSTPDGKVFTNN
jgi:flagellar basal body-associated protein FliL